MKNSQVHRIKNVNRKESIVKAARKLSHPSCNNQIQYCNPKLLPLQYYLEHRNVSNSALLRTTLSTSKPTVSTFKHLTNLETEYQSF